MSSPPAAATGMHPLLARYMQELSAPALDAAGYDAWAEQPGHALVFFSEDPVMYRETLDVAVVVPELAKAYPGRFRCALLLSEPARAIAVRYGFRRWPALVVLRDGRYVGAIDGLRDWNEYVVTLGELLQAEPSRPPSIGIAVKQSGGVDAPHCH
jgi:hydrogenase-1 operon protein HyaE